MKKNLFYSVAVFAVAILMLGLDASAQGLLLNAYFEPANLDANPGVANCERYSLYLTEKGDRELAAIKAEILEDASALQNYTYICHPEFWNTEFNQYATNDYEQTPSGASTLDGIYEPTANTVLIVVYSDESNRDVLVMPGGDEYFYEYFDDMEAPGTGWSENGTIGVDVREQSSCWGYSVGRDIVIKNDNGGRVEIFNMMGALVTSELMTGNVSRICVDANGVYIVRVNGKSSKVVVR